MTTRCVGGLAGVGDPTANIENHQETLCICMYVRVCWLLIAFRKRASETALYLAQRANTPTSNRRSARLSLPGRPESVEQAPMFFGSIGLSS
jgi:hypothetical protein